MRAKLLASCVLVLVVVAAVGQVPAGGFTGKWTYDEATGWEIWGAKDPHAPIATVTVELTADGNTLTGVIHSHTTTTNASTGRKTVSAETRPEKISNGTIDGNNLGFDLVSVVRSMGIKMTTHYTGTLDNGIIHLTGSRYDGDFTYLDTGRKPPPSRKGHLLKTTVEVHRVPDGVISAMQTKQGGETETASAKPLPDAVRGTADSQAKGTPGVWQVNNVTDRMSGKRSFEGFRRYRSNDSQQPGELQVTATCDTEVLNFQIVFLSDAKPGIGLKQNTTGGFGHAKPWVEMRVRIDNDPPRVVTSENDYLNYATIVFSKWAAQGRSREDGAASIARYLLAAKSAGTIEKAIQARSILVELTTENNANELLEIDPQEPSFKVFSSACEGVFWGGVARSSPELGGPAGGTTVRFQQQPHGPAADGFKFMYTLPMPQREYSGSIEEFATVLPAYFQRAATVGGVAGRDFSKEVAFIVDAVNTCSQITSQMAASVFVVKGTVWRKPDGVEELEKLGPQYEVCGKNYVDVSPRVTGIPFETKRGVYLTIRPLGAYVMSNGRERWEGRKGFQLTASFSPMKGDDRDMRGGRLQPTYDYEIIHAFFAGR